MHLSAARLLSLIQMSDSFEKGAIPDSAPRYSHANFIRYEPFALEAIRRFPQPFQISPAVIGVSPETFTCRFRDCIKASLHPTCTWLTNHEYDRARLLEIFGFLGSNEPEAYVLTTSSTEVLIAPKRLLPTTRMGALVKDIDVTVATSGGNSKYDYEQFPQIFDALVTLLAHEVITGIFEFTNLTDEAIEQTSTLYPSISILHEPPLFIVS